MPVRRTSPSTRHGETTERPADVPSAASPTTASSRLHSRPTVPVPVCPADRLALTPAVAYDGDLVVSRRTLAPGLVRRTNAAPCVLLATVPAGAAVPSNQRRQHSRCEATLRLTESRRLSAITQRALSSLTQLDFSHGCRALLTRPFSSTDSNQLSSLAKFSRKPTKHVLFM